MTGNFLIEAWTELGLALLSIMLRLYFRYTQVGLAGMSWDDYLVIVAGIFYALETAAAHVIVAFFAGMGNNNFTPEQRAALIPKSRDWDYAVNGSKSHIFGWFMYTALMWTLKSCWTIYYSRMTSGLQRMDIRIKVAWILNGSTYIAAVCMILFKCWPLHRQWQIYPDPGINCYPGASKLNVTFITVLNIATDLYLMTIPLPIIYKAHLDMRRKVSLIVLFSGGWVVIVFGILRCVTLVTVGPTEPSESGQWSVRESFLAVLVSNAPMVFPLLKHWTHAAVGIVSTQRKDSKGSWPLANFSKDKSSKRTAEHSQEGSGLRKHRVAHPLSIPNDTAWGSDDAIVTMDHDGDKDVDRTKGRPVILRGIPEASRRSPSGDWRLLRGEERSSSVSPGNILMVREWTTVEGSAVPGLESREVHVESAGSEGMQGSVMKLENVRRGRHLE